MLHVWLVAPVALLWALYRQRDDIGAIEEDVDVTKDPMKRDWKKDWLNEKDVQKKTWSEKIKGLCFNRCCRQQAAEEQREGGEADQVDPEYRDQEVVAVAERTSFSQRVKSFFSRQSERDEKP